MRENFHDEHFVFDIRSKYAQRLNIHVLSSVRTSEIRQDQTEGVLWELIPLKLTFYSFKGRLSIQDKSKYCIAWRVTSQ